MPSAEQVIDRYLKAIGGEPAILQAATRVLKGAQTTVDGTNPPVTAPIEVYEKAPDKRIVIAGDISHAYDGKIAWTGDRSGVRELAGDELAEIKREAIFNRLANVKQTLTRINILGIEAVNGRECHVAGAATSDGRFEKLYFDKNTGLLTRSQTIYRTILGSVPETTDFSDYRRVNGLKLPFKTTRSMPPFVVTRQFVEIKQNVSIDDSRFTNPSRK
jgi:hypothetical protein